MDWQKLLRLQQGQEVDYNPHELKGVAKPIFEMSEVIRPRLVISVNFPSGLNVLFGISYHRKKNAFQTRMRLRSSGGQKEVLPSSKWRTFKNEQAFEKHKQELIRYFERLAKERGKYSVKMTKLKFRPDASIKEIMHAFVSSGMFDIVKFDPDKRKAKKLA